MITPKTTVLQQYLPFTVLKQDSNDRLLSFVVRCNSTYRLRYWNEVVAKAEDSATKVATVLTVYGIETFYHWRTWNLQSTLLQQYLPFTVLKRTGSEFFKMSQGGSGCNSTYRLRYWNNTDNFKYCNEHPALQQYLPFTVLKRCYWC